MVSPLTLQGIVNAGGGVIIDARTVDAATLQGLANAAGRSGAVVIVKNAAALNPIQLQGASNSSGAGRVIFDFTESR